MPRADTTRERPHRLGPNRAAALAALTLGAVVACGHDGDLGKRVTRADGGLGQPVVVPGPRHPFGRHDFAYASGSVLPSASADQRDARTAAFYDAWKAKYLNPTCGRGSYYVDMRADQAKRLYGNMDPDSISISEGHGYGMTIVARMAGHDPDARAIFDGMVRFYLAHGSSTAPALMGWDQIVGCVAASRGDDSATDGDLDVAFALLLADAQWGSEGAFDYRTLALRAIAAIRSAELDPATSLPALGDWVTPDQTKYLGAVRTSDLMPEHFRAFARASADEAATFLGAVDASYSLLARMQAQEAPESGLVADFVRGSEATPYSAGPYFMGGSMDGAFGFNACRVPWRIAMDFLATGEPRARAVLAPINAWARATTGDDPRKLRGGYALWGDPMPGASPNELAFIAPLGVAAMTSADHQAWLDAIWAELLAHDVDSNPYYGNTLKLLAMIAMSGNAWGIATPP